MDRKVSSAETARGYSAMELLFVVVIIAIIALVAYPSFSGWKRTAESRKAAREVVSVLRSGRIMAITTNREHRVDFEPDQKRYRIMAGDRANDSVEWTAIAEQWTEIEGNEISMSATVKAIHFNPNGSCNLGTVTISEGDSGHKYKVIVTKTGRVRIS